ncbi:MAG TPA: efflux RND transporter periplasmic adaptor subunit [Psychromonas hadalis]|nr:efflux RND transporter periplasmic adaptor subunit [Psychromonas hadalis]
MKKWIASAIVLAVLVFGTVIGFNMFKAQKIKEFLANRPIPEFSVTTVTAKSVDWTPNLRAIGFIEPKQGVTIANEIGGRIVAINFESGQRVNEGDVLIQLGMEVEKANLKSAKGKLPAVKRQYKRMVSLLRKGSVSQAKVDEAQANLLSLQGQIESYEATISRRIIRAPFSGIVGLRNVYMGEYLPVGTKITRLENMSEMRLRFTIAQNDLGKISIGQKMNIFVDAREGVAFTGEISAIEPAVNYQSGVIQVQASIPNTDSLLRSGMFAKANIILPTIKDQIVLPETSINYTLYGETVYLLTPQTDDSGKEFLQANQRIVKLGAGRDGDVHVLSGVEEGAVVVTSGQIRLSNGAHVKVVESSILNKPSEIPAL